MVKSFNSREIVKRLKADGWELSRTKGDHHQFKHPARAEVVTVSHPVKDLSIGQLRDIFRKAGWDWPP